MATRPDAPQARLHGGPFDGEVKRIRKENDFGKGILEFHGPGGEDHRYEMLQHQLEDGPTRFAYVETYELAPQPGAPPEPRQIIEKEFQEALSPFNSGEDDRRPAHSSTLRQAIMQARAQDLDTLTQLKAACVALDKMERRLMEHIGELHAEQPPTRLPVQSTDRLLDQPGTTDEASE